MSGGGKGGTTTTKVEIPQYIEDASKANLARADEVARTGYIPYMGPDVAAMTGDQLSAMANTNSMASAMGMATAEPTLPQPVQTFANGVQGYSSYPIYEETMDRFASERPGQFDHISGMFIDPVTGAGPTNSAFARDSVSPGGGWRDWGGNWAQSRLDEFDRTSYDHGVSSPGGSFGGFNVPDRISDPIGFDPFEAVTESSNDSSGGGK
jgi:hypothetical protein